MEHEELPPLCAELLSELSPREEPTALADLSEHLRQKAVLSGCERRAVAVGVVWYACAPGSKGVHPGGSPHIVVGMSAGWYPRASLTHRSQPTHFALTRKGTAWLEEEQLRGGTPGAGGEVRHAAAPAALFAGKERELLEITGDALADQVGREYIDVHLWRVTVPLPPPPKDEQARRLLENTPLTPQEQFEHDRGTRARDDEPTREDSRDGTWTVAGSWVADPARAEGEVNIEVCVLNGCAELDEPDPPIDTLNRGAWNRIQERHGRPVSLRLDQGRPVVKFADGMPIPGQRATRYGSRPIVSPADLIDRLARLTYIPQLTDDELARLRAHLEAPISSSRLQRDPSERSRREKLQGILNHNDELQRTSTSGPATEALTHRVPAELKPHALVAGQDAEPLLVRLMRTANNYVGQARNLERVWPGVRLVRESGAVSILNANAHILAANVAALSGVNVAPTKPLRVAARTWFDKLCALADELIALAAPSPTRERFAELIDLGLAATNPPCNWDEWAAHTLRAARLALEAIPPAPGKPAAERGPAQPASNRATDADAVGTVPPVPQEQWLKVSECATLLLKDVSGIDTKKAMSRVSFAASQDKFRTNGKKGPTRRIERVSFDAWRLEQREGDLDKDNDEDRATHFSAPPRRRRG